MVEHRGDRRLGQIVVISVSDTESPLDASETLFRVIVYDSGRDAAVGDHDRLVVGSVDYGVEELDLFDGSGLALCLDKVPYAERLEDKNHHPAGKVLQRTAQSHTDG